VYQNQTPTAFKYLSGFFLKGAPLHRGNGTSARLYHAFILKRKWFYLKHQTQSLKIKENSQKILKIT
jgi:hypothetical protein